MGKRDVAVDFVDCSPRDRSTQELIIGQSGHYSHVIRIRELSWQTIVGTSAGLVSGKSRRVRGFNYSMKIEITTTINERSWWQTSQDREKRRDWRHVATKRPASRDDLITMNFNYQKYTISDYRVESNYLEFMELSCTSWADLQQLIFTTPHEIQSRFQSHSTRDRYLSGEFITEVVHGADHYLWDPSPPPVEDELIMGFFFSIFIEIE